ncbi:hypothetical protein LOZ33_001156 [Ophidiomyces ophidiicola]|nr:hypothetical protein LOZ33_001156 [Ophidiomyces ophidiicola]
MGQAQGLLLDDADLRPLGVEPDEAAVGELVEGGEGPGAAGQAGAGVDGGGADADLDGGEPLGADVVELTDLEAGQQTLGGQHVLVRLQQLPVLADGQLVEQHARALALRDEQAPVELALGAGVPDEEGQAKA